MSQNGQTHFNHLESFLMSDHFGTLCNKLLNLIHLNIVGIKCIFWHYYILCKLKYTRQTKETLAANLMHMKKLMFDDINFDKIYAKSREFSGI